MDKRNIIDMSAFLQDNRHPAIREVEGYWQALRAGRLVPRRSEVDPRVRTLLEQAWRHAKPIGALTDAEPVLSAAGLDAAAAGMLAGTAPQLADGLVDLLEAHRVWERFATVSQ